MVAASPRMDHGRNSAGESSRPLDFQLGRAIQSLTSHSAYFARVLFPSALFARSVHEFVFPYLRLEIPRATPDNLRAARLCREVADCIDGEALAVDATAASRCRSSQDILLHGHLQSGPQRSLLATAPKKIDEPEGGANDWYGTLAIWLHLAPRLIGSNLKWVWA